MPPPAPWHASTPGRPPSCMPPARCISRRAALHHPDAGIIGHRLSVVRTFIIWPIDRHLSSPSSTSITHRRQHTVGQRQRQRRQRRTKRNDGRNSLCVKPKPWSRQRKRNAYKRVLTHRGTVSNQQRRLSTPTTNNIDLTSLRNIVHQTIVTTPDNSLSNSPYPSTSVVRSTIDAVDACHRSTTTTPTAT